MRYVLGIFFVGFLICCAYGLLDFVVGGQTPPDYSSLKSDINENSCLKLSSDNQKTVQFQKTLIRQDVADPTSRNTNQEWTVVPQLVVLGDKIVMRDLTVWEVVYTQERPVLSQIQDQSLSDKAKEIFSKTPAMNVKISATWDYLFSTHSDGWKYSIVCTEIPAQ